MKSIKEALDLRGKKVLVRVDWNVPIVDGEVRDTFRIDKSMETLNFLKSSLAEVTLMTHLEPENLSVEPLRKFVPEGMNLLENLRENPGEKDNSEEFAKSLAHGFDIYVNEAFSVSHREHASIVGVPKFLPSFAGLTFVREVEELSKAFNPEHPFLFILGGAKFETKLPLVEKFLNIADEIIILGANAKEAYDRGFNRYEKVSFPVGDIAALDSNDETIQMCKEKIDNSNLILWNGPLGKYEEGYTKGTEKLAQAIALSGKTSIIGGADTIATLNKLGIFDKFSFVSSGGGAMLDFLANGTLPGIEALN
jgi:phosphoglycerate kinase